ncbi:hypothetical protein H8B09_02180 [Paenibacillus sp. PR3]|uniref:Polymerase nucleotidyl transferase domain-containing protein n=1 Tax=Paenibacillus terricola TaxID=2763503 RepID=A0ABR8MNF7_9BACL|nr:hypothetical protein [Paenibacillus terricola]MBD3917548.1 hypothetical protein [Paenibacillus terricola]
MDIRERIVHLLRYTYMEQEWIYAMWLEGSDGTGSVDHLSDLDIVFDVEDGNEDRLLEMLERTLTIIGPLDYKYEGDKPDELLRYIVYHIEGTPSTLLLDITVQSHSRKYEFVIEDLGTVPTIIFDKKNVVRYCHLDHLKLEKELLSKLYHIEQTFNQQARAKKYTDRGLFLESFAYYQRYVLQPLVELIRIYHTPIGYYMHLIHISRDIPQDVLAELEPLYKVNSAEEIGLKIEQATEMFNALLPLVKEKLAHKTTN